MALTEKLVDPHSLMWRQLVDEFCPTEPDTTEDVPHDAHRQCVVVQTTYGKHTTVIKIRTIITTNPTFGPYRATA